MDENKTPAPEKPEEPTTGTQPEVNEIAPPPPAPSTTEPNVTEVSKKEPEAAPGDEALPAVKQAPDAAPDPIAQPADSSKSDSDTDEKKPEHEAASNDTEPASTPVEPAKETPPAQAEAASEDMAKTHEQDNAAKAAKPVHHEHRNNKKFAVVVVILVACLMAGIATFVFLATQDNTAEAPAAEQSTTVDEDPVEAVPEPATPADTESIDQALDDLDQTLESLDDEADFGEQQLSDESLGL